MSEGISLEEGLASLRTSGVVLDGALAPRLGHYLQLLEKWNRVYNLTAIREPARMVSHHLLDALAVLSHLPDHVGMRLLDVGSGPGIPGLPLAIARPHWRVTLLDSNHKKATFLRQAVAELDARNVDVQVARVEDFRATEGYDVVISRAFSDLATFVDGAARLLGPAGRLVAMKGILPHEEIGQLPSSVRLIDTPAVGVPGLQAQRHLVVLEPV